MPKSWPESRKFLNDGKNFLKKPDVDNIGKSILDSLNGIAYQDDSQVSEVHVSKKYGRTAGVEVEILYYNEKT